jgi:fibronectin-binding autotransporter adhesin
MDEPFSECSHHSKRLGVTKNGSGTVALSGSNTYNLRTVINAGVLSVGTLANGGTASGIGQSNRDAANLVLAGGTLQYTGATASTDRNFTLSTGTTSAFDITTNNLTISGASTATTGGLTKLGAGTLTVSGANAYTGLTDVRAGTLAYGANDALASGAVTVSGGTLDIKTYSDAVGAVTLTSGTIAGSGGVLTGTSYAVQSGAISAILGGSAALTKSTGGTVTLSGVNTYTGLTDVQAGTLAYGVTNALAGGAVTVSGGTLDIKTYSDTVGAVTLTSGTIAGSGGVLTGTSYAVQSGAISAILGGTAALTKSTAGTVTLSGVNTYTGLTNVQAGTLAYGANNALASGAVTVSGGNLDIATYSDTVGAVTLTSGSITGTTGVLTGTSYSLTNTGSVSAILGGGNTVTVTKSGAGTVFLTGANTYQGETTFTSGIVNVATLSNYGVAGSLGSRLEIDEKSGGNSTNVSMHFMGGTLQYTGSTAQSTDRGIRVGLAGGTIDASGSVPSATMNFTKSTTNVDVWDTDGGRMLTLTGSNTGNNTFGINWQERAAGHSSLVKSGTGTWVLTNPHNSDGQTDAYNAWGGYGGGTTLSGGTLGFVNNAIGGGVVDFTGNATLRWESGNTQDLTTGTGAGVARSVKIEDGVRATFNTNGNNVTLSNALAVGPHKTGALTKDGAGILTLSANNTYDGATTVSAGTLVVNGNQAAANGAVSVSGTLAGTGTVGGATTINAGGTHAPGAVGAVGKQNFSGNLHYAAGSIFEWDLNANSTDNPYGMAFDMVGAGGKVVVDTSSTVFRIVFGPLVNMSDSFWSTPFVTRKWAMSTLFGKAISGAFQTVNTGSYPVNPSGRFSIDGEYLYYRSVEESPGAPVVPEPTGALAGLLLGAGLLRRRRLATSGRNMRRRPKAVVIDTPAA